MSTITVDLVSTREGWHELWLGQDSNPLCDFRIQIWLTKFGERMVDTVQAMGLSMVSFLGGDLWIHNDDDQDRCNLFGEKRDCIVGVVTNEQPMTIKVLDSVDIHSNDRWEITSITIPATLNHPDGMESRIPLEQFKRRSGVWRAHFLRNIKSTSSTSSVLDAVRGEELRGAVALLTLKNTSNDQVSLFKVSVYETAARV